MARHDVAVLREKGKAAVKHADSLALSAAILSGFRRAAEAVAEVAEDIEEASRHAAELWEAGGRLVYVGAGASGLIAAQDASELPGTFGLDRSRIRILIAGGVERLFDIDAAAEDEAEAGRAAIAALGDLPRSVVIAVSASGTTPYTLGAARAANEAGAYVIAVACRPGSPLLDLGDASLLLSTGEEALSGSTRLAAGTAQKCALGLFSTLFGDALGHIHAARMVNLKVENEKLRARAVGIVADIARVDGERARSALVLSDGDVKSAILIARGAKGKGVAARLLSDARGRLPRALQALDHSGMS